METQPVKDPCQHMTGAKEYKPSRDVPGTRVFGGLVIVKDMLAHTFDCSLPIRRGSTWVQVWVQLKRERWLPISRKRHQIGQLDFGLFRLLTEGLQIQGYPDNPTKRPRLCSPNDVRTTFGPTSVQLKGLVAPRDSM